MKKILFAFTVLVYTLLIAMSSNAQNAAVPAEVQKSFDANFKNSQYSRWVQLKDAFVATFSEDGTNWKDAYFTNTGEFKGVGKFTTKDRLPIFVQQRMDNYPSGYELIELYQYECNENGICFIARLRNDKHELILKMSPYGDVTYSIKNKLKAKKVITDDAIARTKKD
jgi:hypothetical protein